MSGLPLRFTFVIARYGASILGGAERHARLVAERLAARGHRVRVLTSCATSYKTWENTLPAGITTEHGVEIERFPVARGRRASESLFKHVSHALPGSTRASALWMSAQGPDVPGLLARLPTEAGTSDLLVFFQVLSPTTVFGMPLVARRSALVPLVHRERGVRSRLVRMALTQPHVLLVNTEEEASTIRELAGDAVAPIRVVAVGIDTPPPPSGTPLPQSPYVLFMGRTGKMKPLFRTWRALTTDHSLPPLEHHGKTVPWHQVRLVIAGEHSADAARLPNVVQTGFVGDDTRWDLLRGSVALINPSLYESLSLILLEAWTVERPVVVHARCDVTAGLTARARGGVAVDFSSPTDAARQIADALANETPRSGFGTNGHAFAREHYAWERVLDHYEDAARSTHRP